MNVSHHIVRIALLSIGIVYWPMDMSTARAAEEPSHSAAAEESHAADGEGEANLLAFQPDLAVFSAIVFLLLLAILSKFAWPQIAEALEQRERNIAENIAAAEAKHEEAKRLLSDHEAKLAATAGEVREMLEEAKRDAEATKNRIMAEAQKERQEELKRAVREIDMAKDAAMEDLAVTSANLAIDLARKVVHEQITPDRQASLVREALGSLAVAKPSEN